MSEYRGIARWADDAVGMINWDDTAKEGTAQVTDEKTGQVYQIGGGGGDDGLVELEYTVSESDITLTKTPAELKTLIDAGKGFKIVCNADLAAAISANEGDIYAALSYDVSGSELLNLDFARTSAPLFAMRSGHYTTLEFSNEDGLMQQLL